MGRDRRPTRDEIAAASDRTVPDLLAPGLKVLFCGINPSLYSAAVGHHFARPGNRFWPTLHAAGFSSRVLAPSEGRLLLEAGYGITNLVARATASADELSADELVEGGRLLERKLRRYRPACLAVLGITAFRAAFGRRSAVAGRQPEAVAEAPVWVLPNPSGRNGHFTVEAYRGLFRAVEAGEAASRR